MKQYQPLTRAVRADLDSRLGQPPIIGGKLRFLNAQPLIEHQWLGLPDPALTLVRDRVAGLLPASLLRSEAELWRLSWEASAASVFDPIANDNFADPTPPCFSRGGAQIPPRPARGRGLRPTFFEVLNLLGKRLARAVLEDARKFQHWAGGMGE